MDEEDNKKYPKNLSKIPISTSTNPNTINQLREFISKTSLGYPGVEIQTLRFAGEWESIPRVVFEEIARQAKVNNINLSIHAPVVDLKLPGYSAYGDRLIINEQTIKDNASKLSAVLEAAAIMSKIYGNSLRVNVHAGDETQIVWDKNHEEKVKNYLINNPRELKEIVNTLRSINAIDQNTYNYLINKNRYTKEDLEKLPRWVFAKGIMLYVNEGNNNYVSNYIDVDYYKVGKYGILPAGGEKTIVDVIRDINKNVSENILSNSINKINEILAIFWDSNAITNNIKLKNIAQLFLDRLQEIALGNISAFVEAESLIGRAKNNIIQDVNNLNAIKETLKNFLSDDDPRIKNLNSIIDAYTKLYNYIEKVEEKIKEMVNEKNNEERGKKFGELFDDIYRKRSWMNYANELRNGFYNLYSDVRKGNILPIFLPADKVLYKTSLDTLETSIRNLFDRISGDKESIKNIDKIFPEITIEDSYPNAFSSRPDELVNYIEYLKKELANRIENMKNDKKYSEIIEEIEKKYGSIEKFVEEKVGITIDVGHLKMFEKYGYTVDDVREWLRKVKPYIKHIHINESQWGSDVHLPLGFGWDDFVKKELEELNDIISKEGVMVVHEPGGWYKEGATLAQTFGFEHQYWIGGVDIYGYAPSVLYNQIPSPTFLSTGYFETISPPGYRVEKYTLFRDVPFSRLSYDSSDRKETFSGVPLD